MDYIIGVDAGGTKTEAAAYDLEDNKITSSIAGPGNPAVDFEGAEANIKEAISQCVQNIKNQGIDGACRGIYLGVAGIEVGKNKELLETFIGNTFHCQVHGLHDSMMTHAAILKGEDGIITIAGTGSVSYGCYKGKTGKTGGWGHVLGDQGSGYWIGLAAMKRMTLEQDSEIRVSTLSQRIMVHLDVTSADGMKEFVHRAGKYEIAAVATVVAELAQTGDPNALDILDRAGLELALMTVRLYKKLGISGPVTVGISGGILHNNERVREQFRMHLGKELQEVSILVENISPTKGACYLHSQLQEKKTNENVEVKK